MPIHCPRLRHHFKVIASLCKERDRGYSPSRQCVQSFRFLRQIFHSGVVVCFTTLNQGAQPDYRRIPKSKWETTSKGHWAMIEFLTFLLVVITGFYAWVTFKILKANEGVLREMMEQRNAFYRPYISISPVVYPDNPSFYLKVKNTGLTAANWLKLSMDRDFYPFGDTHRDNLRKNSAFNNIIHSFVPGAEMLFHLAQGFVIFGERASEDITPSKFTVTAQYEFSGRTVNESTVIDLHPYLNSAIPHDPVVRKLEDIKQAIEKASQNAEDSEV